jgi:hypothetical protein
MPETPPPGAPDSLADEAGSDAGLDDVLPDEETTLSEDIAALIDSGRSYAEAELAFQKTRASLVGGNAGKAAAALVLALVLLNIALTALAIGAVLALQPLITIWGAIAVVVGALLVGTGLLVRSAKARGRILAAMFGDGAGA